MMAMMTVKRSMTSFRLKIDTWVSIPELFWGPGSSLNMRESVTSWAGETMERMVWVASSRKAYLALVLTSLWMFRSFLFLKTFSHWSHWKSAIVVETIKKIGEPAVNQNWFKSVKNWKLDRWKQFRSPAKTCEKYENLSDGNNWKVQRKPVKSVKTWAMETI